MTNTDPVKMGHSTLAALSEIALVWVRVDFTCNGSMYNHYACVLRAEWETWDEDRRQAFIAEAREHLAKEVDFSLTAEVVPSAKIAGTALKSGLQRHLGEAVWYFK
jgi:hypothetical protein